MTTRASGLTNGQTASLTPISTSSAPATPPKQLGSPTTSEPGAPSTSQSLPKPITGKLAQHKMSLSDSIRLERPGMGARKSSGTIIVPRDSPTIEVTDEHYEPGDARAMSPRRESHEIEKMSDGAREALESQAKNLQASLLEIVDRVEAVKNEHEKLEGGNKFLQSYIGELMQTSNLTAAGAGKTKSRGRSSRPK